MPDKTTEAPAAADTPVAGPTQSVMRIEIDGPIQAVWDEITKTGEVIPCFFNMRMECARLEPGATMSMRSRNGRHVGVVGEILEVDPPRRFSHTFRFTDRDEAPVIVDYDLRETDAGGTEFTLTVRDMVPGSKTAKQMTSGATMIANTLKACIETGRPSFGTRMLFVLFAATAPLTPKRCRTEHWERWGRD